MTIKNRIIITIAMSMATETNITIVFIYCREW